MRPVLAAFVAGVALGMIVLPLLALTGVTGAQAPGPAATPPPALEPGDLERLRAKQLAFPVEGWNAAALVDDFAEERAGHPHEALDILAPRGTRVLAVDDGVVKRLFTSARGGLTVYQFDESETYCYYYAHLDRYAEGLLEGARVRRGDLLGYVGTSGNAPPQTPHLHFTIFKLGPAKRWWQGTALNPFPLYKLP